MLLCLLCDLSMKRQARSRAWPMLHLADCSDCPDCENSRCWVLPIVYRISQMWRFYYEHNYIRAWPLAHLPVFPDFLLSWLWERRLWGQMWVLPIVFWISYIWRFYYEHNYLKVVQLLPAVTKMVIGSINWAQGNRIMSSFHHFAYWKLHTDDMKCLVYRGGGKEGQ